MPFLQGQLTQDVRQVTSTRSALFGWTNAQGRLLLAGQIFAWQDAIWLSAPASTAESLTLRLRKFILRSRVTVDLSDMVLLGAAHPGQPAPLHIGASALPAEPLACATAGQWLATRVGGDISRVLIATGPADVDQLLGALGAEPAIQAEWCRADICAGLPSIGTEIIEAFIPQMVNLDLLGGVSFTKGCYSGQEIVTRTRHLGRIKRRMLRFRCADGAALVPGATIFGADREVGRVVAGAAAPGGPELLAVTRLEQLQAPLFADAGRSRRLTRLDLPYAVPEAGNVA